MTVAESVNVTNRSYFKDIVHYCSFCVKRIRVLLLLLLLLLLLGEEKYVLLKVLLIDTHTNKKQEMYIGVGI